MSPLLIQNRRYLGGKSKVLGLIDRTMEKVINTDGPIASFVDIFAGTGVVGAHYNTKNTAVAFNDLLVSNSLCHHAWMSTDPWRKDVVVKTLADLNAGLYDPDSWVADNYEGFFLESHATAIGGIRSAIAMLFDDGKLLPREKSILLASLLYASDKVAQTFGHFEAFRKKRDTVIAPFILSPLQIDDSANVGNTIHTGDANTLATSITADVIYIDPPYNSRQYGDAYHVLESIAQWTKPTLLGVTRKPSGSERAATKSDFCTRKAPQAFAELIRTLQCRWIAVSYNNMSEKGDGRSNAKISDDEIRAALETRGPLFVYEQPHKFYTTGKRANIHDHKEIVYLVQVR